jgi:hypothetical protein
MRFKNFWQSDKAQLYIYMPCIITLSVYLGLQRIYLSDFSTVNGDFQTYNIIRRILDGQVPYSDFTNYLGLGIVLINAPFVALHNFFTTSLFVTNATNGLCFALAVTLLLYLPTGNKLYSCFSGILVTLGAIMVARYYEELSWYLGLNLFEPGNSMRMQRAFLAFFLGFIFYYVVKKRKVDISALTRCTGTVTIIGFITSLATAWSADFGLACVFSALIIFLALHIKQAGKIQPTVIFKPFLYLLAVVAGIMVQVVITTRGDLLAYLDFTRGVSAYQYWYYGININKYLSVVDVLGNKTYMAFILLFVLITVHYLRKLLRGTISTADLAAYFIGLSTFIASLIYIYGSSWMAYEAFRLTTLLIGAGLIFKRLSGSFNGRFRNCLTAICRVGLPVMLAVSIVLSTLAAARLTTNRGSPYVKELGGYTRFAEGLFKTQAYIGDEKVFSTYALALEVMTNQFQPTGTDYIIHVLGDKQRQAYIDHFRCGNYQFVTTSYHEYQPFEAWVRRANWFFYRELYKNYRPSFNTDYLVMWEPAEPEKITAEISIEMVRINDYTYEINLKSDNKDRIIADVMLYYQTIFIPNAYQLQTFRRLIAVTDESMAAENYEEWNTYFIPAVSDGCRLPICLENGAGKITLSSLPVQCTVLEVTGLQIIDVLSDYHYSGATQGQAILN